MSSYTLVDLNYDLFNGISNFILSQDLSSINGNFQKFFSPDISLAQIRSRLIDDLRSTLQIATGFLDKQGAPGLYYLGRVAPDPAQKFARISIFRAVAPGDHSTFWISGAFRFDFGQAPIGNPSFIDEKIKDDFRSMLADAANFDAGTYVS